MNVGAVLLDGSALYGFRIANDRPFAIGTGAGLTEMETARDHADPVPHKVDLDIRTGKQRQSNGQHQDAGQNSRAHVDYAAPITHPRTPTLRPPRAKTRK